MNRTALIIISVVVLAFRAFGAIPPLPPERDLFNDFAGIVDDSGERSIRKHQDQVLRDTGIAIVVVTIDRMQDYLPQSSGIDAFARQWFNAWQVGGEKSDGILIRVSSRDRKSRIELGPAWGRDFDDHCKNVMNKEMVSRFKKGEYGAGLVKAVQEMAELARGGPGKKPTEKGVLEQIEDAIPFLANPSAAVFRAAARYLPVVPGKIFSISERSACGLPYNNADDEKMAYRAADFRCIGCRMDPSSGGGGTEAGHRADRTGGDPGGGAGIHGTGGHGCRDHFGACGVGGSGGENPHFPALRSGSMALSGASRRKQITSNQLYPNPPFPPQPPFPRPPVRLGQA